MGDYRKIVQRVGLRVSLTGSEHFGRIAGPASGRRVKLATKSV